MLVLGGPGIGAIIGLLAAIGTGAVATVPCYLFFEAIIGFTLVMPLVLVAMLRTANS